MTGHQREGKGVQGVPGRKAVLIERRRAQLDAGMACERPRAHGLLFQHLVDDDPDQGGQQHVDRGDIALIRIEGDDERDQGIPEDAVAEPADDGEEGAQGLEAADAVDPLTDGGIDLEQSMDEGCGSGRCHVPPRGFPVVPSIGRPCDGTASVT